jgi:serine/threonine protein kinase
LYGYSVNPNQTKQYLVYELSANGSLNGFLRDACNRSRLTSSIRLSIMFEITRVVNFLHLGGCKGYKMFHRDIQSSTIWLSEDFTARLMGCGLSKLVPIITSPMTSSSEANDSLPFGTRGYMCPEYLNNPDPSYYEASYDVYSIGIVMVELILGQLIGDCDCDCDSSSSKLGSEFLDVLRDVVDREGNQAMNACAWLKEHADRSIVWNEESLDIVCKAAIGCLTPIAPGRKAVTEKLMVKVRHACV